MNYILFLDTRPFVRKQMLELVEIEKEFAINDFLKGFRKAIIAYEEDSIIYTCILLYKEVFTAIGAEKIANILRTVPDRIKDIVINYFDLNLKEEIMSYGLKTSITDMVRNNQIATFQYYRDGDLWYKTETDFLFPVPVKDIGNATFNKIEKALLLMRWIRKHLDVIENPHKMYNALYEKSKE